MSIARQLYQLQDIDLEIESDEQTLKLIASQLGESETIVQAQERLDTAQLELEGLTGQQHSVEWEIEDISTKLKKVEEDLYGGRIRNPKELSDLQREAEALKSNLAKQEEQALEAMEKVETAKTRVSSLSSELKRLKTEWDGQQKKLSSDIEKLKAAIASLNEKRQRLAATIDTESLTVYQELRKSRGASVTRVEQGTCGGCRISLSVSEMQRVRGSSMVRCSSCGRILYLP